MNKRIVGVFMNEYDASRAIGELKSRGFRTEDISVIARNKEDMNAVSEETGTKAPEGMASGAATGGLLGGVTGLLAGIGALAIPGIGPIIAAGPIAATLAGAVVGAGTGGLVGGLVGLGIPEDEAESYNRYVDEGHILVMVDADTSQESVVYETFRTHNSLNSHYYGAGDTMPRSTMTDASVTDNPVNDRQGGSIAGSVDGVFNGSGLEGKHDTGLDTMNSNPASVREDLDVTAPGKARDVSGRLPTDTGMNKERKQRPHDNLPVPHKEIAD
ncbi:Heat induced stress protein YflT [Paenibacillus sophorae]|uniref:General stress protein n=1 Tax=Paenibacillus sophorae TaxID=1333845 RepID=A0A1H8LM33_9BACL|nr:general stress protein [Paenibacillus sophorae]QWU17234.1 general stress protein [Paenibacillus sophorae]SEO06157.1 Heat induced stress protein YflT [Paenibacillus sophorae]